MCLPQKIFWEIPKTKIDFMVNSQNGLNIVGYPFLVLIR